MSAEELLKDEVARLEARIAELVQERDKRLTALDALEGVASVEATVRASVSTRAQTRRGARRQAEVDKEIHDLIRGAGTNNVEAVRTLMRAVKTMSQRDIATNLDLNPANVSKSVHALKLMGELRLTGEKDGRSQIWTTQGVRQTTTTEAW